MDITNLTTNVYELPGVTVHADETVTISNERYRVDEHLRLTVNTLYANTKVSVADAPPDFPWKTDLEIEIEDGERPGGGGSSFNGGTVTNPFNIAQTTGDVRFGFEMTHDDYPNFYLRGRVKVDGDVELICQADGEGRSKLTLADDTEGGLTTLGSDWGLEVSPRPGGSDGRHTLLLGTKDGAVPTTVALKALADGSVIFGRVGAIPDAWMAASIFGFWLDDTPDAAVLHVKAQDANGTVVTAAIPLS